MNESGRSFDKIEQATESKRAAEREAVLTVAHEVDPSLREELLRYEEEQPLHHEAAIDFLETIHPGSAQRIYELTRANLEN